jgi:non-specific protein-tyrosine kinase
MSHLEAALRRAMLNGVLKPAARVLDAPAEAEAVPVDRAFPSESPSTQDDRLPRPADRPRGRAPSSSVEGRLPPEVIGQLGNLAETLAQQNPRPRIIGFASPGRGEGTSTCLAALGVYLASRHDGVLAIDANHHNPALHAIAGVAQSPGLAELLAADLELGRALQPTALPALFVIASGAVGSGRSGGRLSPAALHERLVECAARFDMVLVDCPAVNAYGDAASIAAVCDAVVLVVDAGRTRREAAQASKALLERANCLVVGAFMNRRRFYIPQFLYDRL